MAYVTSQELQTQLEQFASDLGVSVQELLTSYYTKGEIDSTIAGITSRLDAIDVIDATDGVDTLAEKIKAINDLLTDPTNNSLATDILNRISTNASDIATEASRAQTAEAAIQVKVDANTNNISQNASDIATLNSTVTNNKAALDAADAALDSRVSSIESTVSTLTGDESVVGSVDNKIAQERARAQAAEAALEGTIASSGQDAVTNANNYTDSVASGLDAHISGVESRVDELQGDSSVPGSVDSKIEAHRVSAEAVMDSKVDAAVSALDATDADLQAQIDALAGTGSGSIGDLEGRVSTIEDDLNDTTDGSGNLVKGVKSRLTDVESLVSSNKTALDATDADLQAQIDALQGAGLETGIIDGRAAANKFRAVFGLAALGSTGSGL